MFESYVFRLSETMYRMSFRLNGWNILLRENSEKQGRERTRKDRSVGWLSKSATGMGFLVFETLRI